MVELAVRSGPELKQIALKYAQYSIFVHRVVKIEVSDILLNALS